VYSDLTNVREFVDAMQSNSFFPLIDKPTRITPTSSTLIDNIFTNVIQNSHTSGILYADLSDHLPIWSAGDSIPRSTPNQQTQFRSFCERNVSFFLEELRGIPWDDVSAFEDGQAAFTKFTELFLECFERSFPLVSRRPSGNRSKPWLSAELKRLINRKNKLYKRFIRIPSFTNESEYKRLKAQTAREIRLAKRTYYHDLLERNKGKVREV